MAVDVLTNTWAQVDAAVDVVQAQLGSDSLTFTGANPAILGADTDGVLLITPSNVTTAGGVIALFGDAHATKARDIEFRDGVTVDLHHDVSASLWDFQANAIATTGALAAGPLAAGATTLSGNLVVSNGNGVIIGDAAQINVAGTVPELQVLGTGVSDSRTSTGRFSADAGAPIHTFVKSRAAIGAFATVVAGDALGQIVFYGDDGSDYSTVGAAIIATSEGTIAGSRIPSKLELRTATDAGPSVSTTAMTLDSAQLVTMAAGLVLSTGEAVLPDGTAGVPSLSFAGHPSTGIYQPGADRLGIANSGVQTMDFSTANTVAIGTTATGIITAIVEGAGADVVLGIQNSAGALLFKSGTADLTMSAATGSVTASAVRVARDTTSLRSINAEGTVNASGADYAEYERLAQHIIDRMKNGGPGVAKGDIIGFDSAGQVTDRFSESVTFGIKSTDPSYVGGDTWHADVGEAPDEPKYLSPEYTGSQEPRPLYDEPLLEATAPVDPGESPETGTLKLDGETDESYAIRQKGEAEAMAVWAMATALYNRDEPIYNAAALKHDAQHEAWLVAQEAYAIVRGQYDQDQADYAALCEDQEAAVKAAHPTWVKDLDAFKDRLEAARICVDRIAYSGKVPVNGADSGAVGSYVLPQLGPDDSIDVYTDANPTQPEYRTAVGRIRNIGVDGRAIVDVLRV